MKIKAKHKEQKKTSAKAASIALLAFAIVTVFPVAFPLGDASATTNNISFGSASQFSVFSHTSIVGAGTSTISGKIGTTSSDPTVAGDVEIAYMEAKGRPYTSIISGDLINSTFTPGVFFSSTAITNTGTITLDAQGNSDAVFIFQVGAALNSGAGSSMTLKNGAKFSNVYWQVSTATTLGANSHFYGTILSKGAVTLGAGVYVTGQALAYQAAITLDTDTFAGVFEDTTPTPTPTPTPTATNGSDGDDGANGDDGVSGIRGQAGATGPAGDSGTSGKDLTTTDDSTIKTDDTSTVSVTIPNGTPMTLTVGDSSGVEDSAVDNSGTDLFKILALASILLMLLVIIILLSSLLAQVKSSNQKPKYRRKE